MNIYKSEMLNEIFTDEQFLTDYTEYREDNTEIAEFNKFIDSIELNRKYFRLEMNKKKGFRSKNKNISEDTIALKEINSLLNKTTDKNVLSIRQKIKGKIENKSYLTEMIIHTH
jgi:5'-deoxynucleotidase YfbR-like HD superfamily hydrolase